MVENFSCKELAEKEVYDLLVQFFGEEDIQREPKVDNKRADFLVKSQMVYIEVYSVKDITSDIVKIEPISPVVSYIIPKKELLDKLRGKIIHESNHFPDNAKNVLIIKTEDLYVTHHDVVDVFMEPIVRVYRDTMKTETIYRHHFRTEEELEDILKKISAIIAYDSICMHGKMKGIFINNKENADFPLDKSLQLVFKEMICEKCFRG